MKANQSGNGVKVANRFKIVRLMQGKNYWSNSSIERMKSPEMLAVWNYKAEGLNLDLAKAELLKAVQHRVETAHKKPKPIRVQSPGRMLSILDSKKERIRYFIQEVEKADPINTAYQHNYGSYKYKRRTFVVPNTNTKYPVTATITWDEETDWDYYAKSYNRPKSTYSNRRIIFKSFGKIGQATELYTHDLANFAGHFVEKALAAFFKTLPVKYPKELAPIQLDNFFTVNELKAINGFRLFQRLIGPMAWDYAILDTKTRNTYHAYNYDDLIPGLRKKINSHLSLESELINKQTGFKLGYCETGMRNFCSDNDLDFNASYTRQELRNKVIQNREINLRKYRKELAKVGIKLGK